MLDNEYVIDCFEKQFGHRRCAVFTAPARVNLIGEHTDYNDGYVLPASIDKCITVAIRTNNSTKVNAYSIDYNSLVSFEIGGDKPKQQWSWYIYGVIEEMKKRGAQVGGFNCVIGGDIPLESGMASSAALESVVGYAINDKFGLWFSRKDLAVIGQAVEHNYIGMRCGIMDQFVSLLGKENNLLRLDCRSLDYELIPFYPKDYRLILIDTMIKHPHDSSEYNIRREQCEKGVSVIASHNPKVKSLRDVSITLLEKFKDEMSPVIYKRCLYVLKENKRLLSACRDIEKGDYEAFGAKMYASHDGLSKEYEVSCKESDFIVDISRKNKSVAGARMMGRGFGGCVISFVKDDGYDEYVSEIKEKYIKKFKIEPRIIDFVISGGAKKWLAKKAIPEC